MINFKNNLFSILSTISMYCFYHVKYPVLKQKSFLSALIQRKMKGTKIKAIIIILTAVSQFYN